MGYKTLRNTALQGVDRLIIGYHNGAPWYAPGGWFAVRANIYDGYKFRKDQYTPEGHPDMASIIDNLKPGRKVAAIKRVVDSEYADLLAGDMVVRVQDRWLALISELYPEGKLTITTALELVQVHEHGELVGLIMPVRG